MALIDNLVSYWKLDESSGDASDSVGSLTLTNANVTYGAAKINNGANFNGTSSRLTHSSSGNLTGDFSISFWVKYNSFAGGPMIYSDWSLTNRNIFLYTDTGGILYFYRGNGGASQDATPAQTATLSTGTWYHIVVTQSGTSKKMYVNAGTPTTATATYTGGSTGASSTFCVYATANADYLNGTLDEVGFWTRELTASEVTQLYNVGAGLQYPFSSSSTFSPRLALMGVGR